MSDHAALSVCIAPRTADLPVSGSCLRAGMGVIAAVALLVIFAAASQALALPRPGRPMPEHPDAAVEQLLAAAQSRLIEGDAAGALALLADVDDTVAARAEPRACGRPATEKPPAGVEASSANGGGSDSSTSLQACLRDERASLPPRQAFRRAHIEARALLALGRRAEAVVPLRAARAAAARGPSPGRLSPQLERELALAEHAVDRCDEALAAFARGGARAWRADAEAIVIKARCEHGQGDLAAALATVAAAGVDTVAVRAASARIKVEAGLHKHAGDDVAAIAANGPAALLHSLATEWSTSAPDLSRALIDAGMVRFPADAGFPIALARLDHKRTPAAAAALARRASALDRAYVAEAVELLRSAGDAPAAARLHAQAPGDADAAHLRQRLALAVDAGAWDRARALQPRLARAGLIDDDAVAYALAWAHHETGDTAAAQSLLDGIADPTWFERATALRAVIAQQRKP